MSNYMPISHTFTYTTNPDGSLKDTYSWGNDNHSWKKNKCEDKKAAEEAIKDKSGQYEGGGDFDTYINSTFNAFSTEGSGHDHPNGWIWNNCKTETAQLINTARQVQGISQPK